MFNLLSLIILTFPNSALGQLLLNRTLYQPLKTSACMASRTEDLLRLEAYVERGESVSGTNFGLIDHFQNLMAQPCFEKLACDFWSKIQHITQSYEMDQTNFQRDAAGLARLKPNIDEQSGYGRYKEFPPGWLWKEALAAANGDANIAITVLGACMHDDFQVQYTKSLTEEESANLLKNQISDCNKKITDSEQKLIKMGEHNLEAASRKLLISSIENEKEFKRSLEKKIAEHERISQRALECPSFASPIFAPGALGAGINLPKELIQSILKIQKPNQMNPTKAAKAYHFIGGALIGCEAAKCGMSVDAASDIAAILAQGYRRAHLFPKLKKLIADRDNLADSIHLSSNDSDFPEKAVSQMMSIYNTSGMSDPKAFMNKMKALQSLKVQEYDAATLYQKWYLGSSVGLYSGIRVAGPADLSSQSGANKTKDCGIPSWSRERCAAAIARLSTWDVDEVWTKTQHQIGAQFGAKNCHPPKVGESEICPRLSSSPNESESKTAK